jgi:hypothetical protein
MVGSQERAIAEKRPETARPQRRSNSPPERSQRSTAPSPSAAATQTVTAVGNDAACPPMIAPRPPTTRTASTGPGPRSSASPKTSSISSSSSSRPRSRSLSRMSDPGRAGTTTAACRSSSRRRSFTNVNLCRFARIRPQAPSASRTAARSRIWGRSHSQPDRTPAIGPREAPCVYLTIQVLELSGVTDAYRNRESPPATRLPQDGSNGWAANWVKKPPGRLGR